MEGPFDTEHLWPSPVLLNLVSLTLLLEPPNRVNICSEVRLRDVLEALLNMQFETLAMVFRSYFLKVATVFHLFLAIRTSTRSFVYPPSATPVFRDKRKPQRQYHHTSHLI